MPVESLKPLVHALLSQVPDDPSSIVISVKSETDSPAATNGQRAAANSPVYDPSLVYVLELCTVLALRDEETVAALGADVAEALQNIMRNQKSWHTIMTSRTIYYILSLLHASYVSSLPIALMNSINSSRIIHSCAYRSFSTQSQASRKVFSKSLQALFCKGLINVSRNLDRYGMKL